ncbi:hypothetical protein ACET9K_12650 [Aeromonas enteropelogenes]|uniref:hypothetical protein n=1 Tax=Aeromonas TaxID=642 RepID=UPI000817EA99|nr:hypothetical protein A6767_13020 [Aeromonas veronii]
MSPSTKNSSRLKSAKITSQSSDTRHMAMIGEKIIDLCLIAYVRRFRPLSFDSQSPYSVGLYSIDHRRLSYLEFPDEEQQQLFLDNFRSDLHERGLLERFVDLTEGTLMLPSLIEWADHGPVDLGHVVRLHVADPNTPPVTGLFASKEASMEMLKTLARLLSPAAK